MNQATPNPSAPGEASPRPRRSSATLLMWVRRALLVYAIGGAFYLQWRFDLRTLPADGISPLHDFSPGSRLLIDTRERSPRIGEAVLFRDDQGRILLARSEVPPDVDAKLAAGWASEGKYWLSIDNAALDLPDSSDMGPIGGERIVGRVVCALPRFE